MADWTASLRSVSLKGAMVQRAGLHSHQDFIIRRDGVGGVFELQDIGPTELVESDCLHSSIASAPSFTLSADSVRSIARRASPRGHKYRDKAIDSRWLYQERRKRMRSMLG